jgi:putative membrane protein
MDNQQNWPSHRHFFAWGIVALVSIITIFATIGLVLYYYPPAAPAGAVYPFYYPWFGARILFGLFFIFAIFWVLRWAFWGWGWRYRRGYWGGGYGYWRHRDSSYYILRERYAKGEISKEQYDQMMRDLDQHTTTP